jgi:large subunit ribosomal protein L9
MANKQVILREKISGLGAEADVVKVKAGFANNYLVPQGKAYEATKENLQQIEDLKAARIEREAEELATARKLARKIKAVNASFELATGQRDKAFGSVTSIDIHRKLKEAGIEIERTAILLNAPIKNTGKFDIEIKLHDEVTTKLNVNVAAKED